MDIDAFSLSRKQQWERLDFLAHSAHLSGQEADELVQLYRQAARDLSRIRTQAPDPVLIAQMSVRVSSARGRLTAPGRLKIQDIRHYVTVSVPAALYRVRWWTVGVMLAELVVALIAGIWTLHTPQAMAALGTQTDLDNYARASFASYYHTYAPQDFAAMIWANNAFLALLCVVSGITGILPAIFLYTNAVSLGQAGAIMADHHLFGIFLALISPHGLLELSCVFIAGGVGLKLFWTLLVPGARTRLEALAAEGRALVTVSIALAVFLAASALIEAFVTPAPVPWGLKIVVGALVVAVLWAYTLGLGSRAARQERSDDLDFPAGCAGEWVTG